VNGATVSGTAAVGPADAEPADAAAYRREIDAWQAQRLEKLTAPDGWLTLVGLYRLEPGTHRLGSGRGCDLQLVDAAPSVIGELTISATGVKLAVKPGVELYANRTRVRTVDPVQLLTDADVTPTVCRVGSVSFQIIERGGVRFLRVRDAESDVRRRFQGIPRFPVDRGWRVTARLEPTRRPQTVDVTNVLGQTEPQPTPGKLVFELAGRRCELTPVGGPGEPLFIVFADSSNGVTTYEGGRFLSAEPPGDDNTVVLDFNRAINPPCAFTHYATCPLPPRENHLPLSVNAGERKWQEAP
jgi:uncharacterized protein (DUF1684 family)